MPDLNAPSNVLSFEQFASHGWGNPGNYWQRNDGEVEIIQTGPGEPKPIYDRMWGAGFLVQRSHRKQRRYSEEFIGHFATFAEAVKAGLSI